ncbi:MAG: MoaD/ThiS family protein [Coriobacteriia bacterium]|nr:MoaD/ThiS family protein [Coriobacteriia bacterium]
MTIAPASVRAFAFLHDVRRSRGQSPHVELDVPSSGMSAFDIARTLELPLDLIGGEFLNGMLFDGDVIVRPGDRVAFVPKGTPAFHPAFFGSRQAS